MELIFVDTSSRWKLVFIGKVLPQKSKKQVAKTLSLWHLEFQTKCQDAAMPNSWHFYHFSKRKSYNKILHLIYEVTDSTNIIINSNLLEFT